MAAGLIANITFYNEARKERAVLGRDPEGYGCLTALLWVFAIIPGALIALFVVLGFASAIGSH